LLSCFSLPSFEIVNVLHIFSLKVGVGAKEGRIYPLGQDIVGVIRIYGSFEVVDILSLAT